MPRKGQKHSPETLAKLRANHKGMTGRHHSAETIAKISAAQKGRPGLSGEASPSFGRKHTEEAKEKNRQAHLGRNVGNQFAKGYHHTPEAIDRIKTAGKLRWEAYRNDPSLCPAVPMEPERMQGQTGRRIYARRFTAAQRAAWKHESCDWCGATENLELDHIIAKFLGGTNTQENAQTLCQPCNQWKMQHVDIPQYKARYTTEGT